MNIMDKQTKYANKLQFNPKWAHHRFNINNPYNNTQFAAVYNTVYVTFVIRAQIASHFGISYNS